MLYFLQTLLLFTLICTAAFSSELVSKCVENKLSVTNFRSSKDDTFCLHFGDPAVEVFNVLSHKSIKTLDYLKECTIDFFPANHLDRSKLEPEIREKLFAGGNVTELTYILNSYYNHITNDILTAIRDGIAEAGWEYHIESLRISSVEYIESISPNRKISLAEIIALNEEKLRESKKYALVVNPASNYDNNINSDYIDIQSDSFVQKYLHAANSSSSIIAIINLSDRIKFTGGTVFVEKEVENLNVKNDDNYDAIDEDVANILANLNTIGVYDPNRFSPLNTKIGRYVPELGGMVLIKSSTMFGIEPIREGAMKAVIVSIHIN